MPLAVTPAYERGCFDFCGPVAPSSSSDTSKSHQPHSCRPGTRIPLALTFFLLFFPKQTIRELFDMPLEEPSGSSLPSAPEEEEETVASKQTHILEQVKKVGNP